MALGPSMAGGNPIDGRNENDFYQTEPAATHALMRFLSQVWYRDTSYNLDKPLLIWEPACGEGAISEVLLSYHEKFVGGVVSSDLIDRGYGHGGHNFMNFSELPVTQKGRYDTIITNPPFVDIFEFFRHAEKLGAQRIIFLLKAQFWHSNWLKAPQTSKQMWESWQPSWWLPLTWRPQFMSPEDLQRRSSKPVMDVAWCVWDRNATHQGCKMVPLQKPIEV